MISQKQYLLNLARKAIENYFLNKNIEIKGLNINSRVFVTLYKNNELRGCIGFTNEMQIEQSITKASLLAAFKDPRFEPLKKDELKDIKIEISALTKPELIKVSNHKEYLDKIEIGKDGLIVEHEDNSGLLLPKVASEHNLDVESFLNNVCLKAGLDKNIWHNPDCKIYKFNAIVFSE